MNSLSSVPTACGYAIFVCLSFYVLIIVYLYSKDMLTKKYISPKTLLADMLFILFILFFGIAFYNEGINSSIYKTYKVEIRLFYAMSAVIYYGLRKNLYIMKNYHKHISKLE